jgi:hypothetical protein
MGLAGSQFLLIELRLNYGTQWFEPSTCGRYFQGFRRPFAVPRQTWFDFFPKLEPICFQIARSLLHVVCGRPHLTV